ncbi:CoA ester lyase [uncultured Roseobacter sp.]|uniref:HpcH/HpaI aldolase/citrate lyase family protein n=1 Tax=uncultured Roseobacter sp. TaxID=114847 RepID=UPI00262298D1|nr:CoA ester lyase [uncultured Roseobacter sp.]
MSPTQRPLRSVLYIPASRPRALDKARQLLVDAIIFDLEDAVAPDEKDAGRETLKAALAAGGYGQRLKIVRINGLDTPWGAADAAAATQMGADAVLLPKVGSPEDLDALAQHTGALPLWAMMETAQGMLNAPAIAAHPLCQGMVMGTNDLAKEMGTRFRADRLPLMAGLGACLLAAKAAGIAIIDGVYNAFQDTEGLAVEAEQGRDMGFDGKTLIHPAQIGAAHAAFSPDAGEIDLAERQIAAYDEAVAGGQAVAVVDGRIVENLHVEMARETLAKQAAIAAMSGE